MDLALLAQPPVRVGDGSSFQVVDPVLRREKNSVDRLQADGITWSGSMEESLWRHYCCTCRHLPVERFSLVPSTSSVAVMQSLSFVLPLLLPVGWGSLRLLELHRTGQGPRETAVILVYKPLLLTGGPAAAMSRMRASRKLQNSFSFLPSFWPPERILAAFVSKIACIRLMCKRRSCYAMVGLYFILLYTAALRSPIRLRWSGWLDQHPRS